MFLVSSISSNTIVTFSALILAISCLLIAFVLRLCRKRLTSSIFELISAVSFVTATAQYALLIGKALDWDDVTHLLLFIFAVVVLVYKLISFIRYRR